MCTKLCLQNHLQVNLKRRTSSTGKRKPKPRAEIKEGNVLQFFSSPIITNGPRRSGWHHRRVRWLTTTRRFSLTFSLSTMNFSDSVVCIFLINLSHLFTLAN
ncbi:hypothetical protein HanLR1_Chr08g0280311 [Helianthus annuus]|nr:hypothetical protein HanHA89_Chr08g0298761 [Helianthus annuus]KAJ0719317.1 hypothetical protein HanLR1_Chr08g0280311 [Helianthus annuus]